MVEDSGGSARGAVRQNARGASTGSPSGDSGRIACCSTRQEIRTSRSRRLSRAWWRDLPLSQWCRAGPRRNRNRTRLAPALRGDAIADDIVTGVRIKTDWTASPPVASAPPRGTRLVVLRGSQSHLHAEQARPKRKFAGQSHYGDPVGAGRSGPLDRVAGPVSRHRPSSRPVYTFGGTGILNVLDASTGALVWSHDAAADTGVKVPGWGFASSPLVVDDVVIVAAAGNSPDMTLPPGQTALVRP